MNFIVGLKNSFKQNDCEFVFLNNILGLESFLVFDNSKFKYGKVSLAEKTFVDYENLTFWFEIKKYKSLWDKLIVDLDSVISEDKIFLEQNLIDNFFRISDYFNCS